MMGRSNYHTPRYVEHAFQVAVNEHDPKIVNPELVKLAKRYDALLREIYRTIDGYSQLLETHGPYHEVELGEPLSRFEKILRKALNDSE